MSKFNHWMRTVQVVAWSFLGVRKNSEYQEDKARVTPVQVIIIGLMGGILLVIGLMLVVRWIVRV